MESASDNLQEGRDGELNSQGEPPIFDLTLCVCVYACARLSRFAALHADGTSPNDEFTPQVYETCLFVYASAHGIILGLYSALAFIEYLAQLRLWLHIVFYILYI